MRLVQVFSVAMAATAVLTGCGKGGSGGIVSDSQVKTYTQGSDLYGELSVKINTGSVLLPAFSKSIDGPQGGSIGTLSMSDMIGGGTKLDLAVDLTQVTHLQPVEGGLLPNGTPIPIGIPSNVPVMSFSVNNSKTKVYFAFGHGVAMFGAAVTLTEMQQLGKLFGGLNYFPAFGKAGQVKGVAGVFTSSDPTKNGLAVFVDVSTAIKPARVMELANTGGIQAASLSHSLSSDLAGSRIIVRDQMPSGNVRARMQKALYDLSRKHTRLHLE